MDVESDFTDVDQFFDDVEWEVQKGMIDVGDETVKDAKANHTYQNRTGNLEKSNTFDVDKDGLTLENTAEYASYVEAKGFVVLSDPALRAEKKLKEMFE